MGSSCDTSSSCSTQGTECRCAICAGGGNCSQGGGDCLDAAVGMWSGSFCQAIKEVQVDLLKAKMQKAWGGQMDKAADAVLEAMGVQWQSMVAQAQAKGELRERLRALFQQRGK